MYVSTILTSIHLFYIKNQIDDQKFYLIFKLFNCIYAKRFIMNRYNWYLSLKYLYNIVYLRIYKICSICFNQNTPNWCQCTKLLSQIIQFFFFKFTIQYLLFQFSLLLLHIFYICHTLCHYCCFPLFCNKIIINIIHSIHLHLKSNWTWFSSLLLLCFILLNMHKM